MNALENLRVRFFGASQSETDPLRTLGLTQKQAAALDHCMNLLVAKASELPPEKPYDKAEHPAVYTAGAFAIVNPFLKQRLLQKGFPPATIERGIQEVRSMQEGLPNLSTPFIAQGGMVSAFHGREIKLKDIKNSVAALRFLDNPSRSPIKQK